MSWLGGFRSKTEVVYDLLRENIQRGKYMPGSRLVIDELTASLGVSQIPIREAMRQLEADGFVTIEPYVGATVTGLSADFIYEVFALLEHMEVVCSRAACRLMTDEQFEQLEQMTTAMDTCVADADTWSALNKEMHLFVCRCAGMKLIHRMMAKVLDHWDRLRIHYLNDVFGHRIQAAQDDHKRILEVFLTRDADEVEKVIRAHNQAALQSYIHHLQAVGVLPTNKDSIP